MSTTITIRDVAKVAGVSTATVSKIINNKGKVSDEIRVRVEAVIERLNYRPSLLARNIRHNRTNLVGLIIPQILNSFFDQLVAAIEKEVSDRGYALVLSNTSESFEAEKRYLRAFSTMRVAGLILASSGSRYPAELQDELRVLKELNIPTVLLVRQVEGLALDAVVPDNETGAWQATRHLIENGHRRIAIISSAVHTPASSERIAGYMRALSEMQVPHDRELIRVGTIAPDGSYNTLRELAGLAHPPSAVFVASNMQLLGALRAVRDLRLRVPDDLSLVCFDDTEWSSLVTPPLTVVGPRTAELSHTAAAMLFDRIEGTYTGPPRTVVVPNDLIARESVKTIR